jgi:uncharacterized membrane protein
MGSVIPSIDAERIRTALREGDGPSLYRRRRIAALATVGLVDFGLISLYQIGVLRRLPDLPGDLFDSNQVNAAEAAYRLGLPDGTTGAGLYAALLMAASAGGSRETGRRPLFSKVLLGLALSGAAAAAVYLWEMIFRQRKACPYCLVGAAVNFTILPLAWREAIEARREGRVWRG